MGLFIATTTTQNAIAEKKDLEAKILTIQKAKMDLSNASKDLINAGSDLDPESPAMKQLELRKQRLNTLEMKLDMELEEYKTRLSMVKVLLDDSKRMEQEAIDDMRGH